MHFGQFSAYAPRGELLRVLFLALDVDLSAKTGDSIHVQELARFLAGRGHYVRVVCAKLDSPCDVPPGVEYHVAPLGSDWKLVRFCARLASRDGCDVIYERRLSPKIAFAVSRLCSKPFVVEINGIPEEAGMLRGQEPNPHQRLRTGARRWMFRAARIVTVSDRLAERMRMEYHVSPGRIETIPNGVDVERFKPVDLAEARRALPPLTGRLVLFVGNLVPWQGVEMLIRASTILQHDHPDLRFLIVGDGIQRPDLENLAARLGTSDRVVFLGAVPHEAVPAYIGASEVCIAPFTRSRNEIVGLSPLKVYEYLSCGRPVVVSDLPGLEFVRMRAAGLTVPPDDPGALAHAISRLVDNREDARAMGERGREYVVRERSWARTAEQVEHVLFEAGRESHGA